MTRVTLHIDELVLHGVDAGRGDGEAVGEAVRAELTRRLAEGALPPGLMRGRTIDRVVARDVSIPSGARGAGEAIGGAVHAGLTGVDAPRRRS